MTPEMFIGGLIVLMMVVGLVVAMTSQNRPTGPLSDWFRGGKWSDTDDRQNRKD